MMMVELVEPILLERGYAHAAGLTAAAASYA
jgi:hypothetical protein